ncbi:hypothetical protein F4553_007128 [Allocatelliglobosispora scoriae]|uniref:Uncharacterized protein n=1 Tax=Allocatelliglobosispora scoriae TaxID=643052 RepID=A0A841BZY8_9ACTN|nr:hypothetical protein [Allocatelliglobosispora scoriae]MBB5873694.1 hypothetical protein [Allocatelliglobosispora scoriae]
MIKKVLLRGTVCVALAVGGLLATTAVPAFALYPISATCPTCEP